jgi:hypothetical protein
MEDSNGKFIQAHLSGKDTNFCLAYFLTLEFARSSTEKKHDEVVGLFKDSYRYFETLDQKKIQSEADVKAERS